MIDNIQYLLQHLLPLPFFLTLAPNIWEHFKYALASESYTVPVINLQMPILVVYLIGNILTQYPFTSNLLFH